MSIFIKLFEKKLPLKKAKEPERKLLNKYDKNGKENPYYCEKCDFDYEKHSDLQAHEKLKHADDDKPKEKGSKMKTRYHCSYCGSDFGEESRLFAHIKGRFFSKQLLILV